MIMRKYVRTLTRRSTATTKQQFCKFKSIEAPPVVTSEAVFPASDISALGTT
jgi:hypothetical protein